MNTLGPLQIDTPWARASIGTARPAAAYVTIRRLAQIPPGEEVRLEPGGTHIMLMQLRQPLKEGDSIPITFIFGEAGEITVTAPIASLAARTPPE